MSLAVTRRVYCLVAQLHMVNDIAEIILVATHIAKIKLIANLRFLPSNTFLRFLHYIILVLVRAIRVVIIILHVCLCSLCVNGLTILFEIEHFSGGPRLPFIFNFNKKSILIRLFKQEIVNVHSVLNKLEWCQSIFLFYLLYVHRLHVIIRLILAALVPLHHGATKCKWITLIYFIACLLAIATPYVVLTIFRWCSYDIRRLAVHIKRFKK